MLFGRHFGFSHIGIGFVVLRGVKARWQPNCLHQLSDSGNQRAWLNRRRYSTMSANTVHLPRQQTELDPPHRVRALYLCQRAVSQIANGRPRATRLYISVG
jgi:hypothetical protein